MDFGTKLTADFVSERLRQGAEIQRELTGRTARGFNTPHATPVMDGHATIRALRKMNPDVKLIAVSGLSESGVLEQLCDDGVATLAKPYSPDNLLNAIHSVLHPGKI